MKRRKGGPKKTEAKSPSEGVHTDEGRQDKRPWRKILYEEQDYPDNYVDASFLDKLEMNCELRGRKRGIVRS